MGLNIAILVLVIIICLFLFNYVGILISKSFYKDVFSIDITSKTWKKIMWYFPPVGIIGFLSVFIVIISLFTYSPFLFLWNKFKNSFTLNDRQNNPLPQRLPRRSPISGVKKTFIRNLNK